MNGSILLLAAMVALSAKAGSDGGATDETPAPPPPPPEVSVSEPRLKGGEIPLLVRSLEKTRERVGRCVAEHGGLEGKRGRIDFAFIVREHGRAEGVEISGAQKITSDAAKCVQQMLKNRWVGSPSEEPVAVRGSYHLRGK